MKLTVPLKKSEDVLPLIQCGADEFYCAYLDESWYDNFGYHIEYNRRGNFKTHGCFQNQDDFQKAIKLIKHNEKVVYLTCNAIHVTEEMLPYFENIIAFFASCGGDGVIISSVLLVDIVKKYHLKLVISSCCNVTTTYGAMYWQSLGANKIIFPRDVTLKEIHTITQCVPDMEYEAFIFNGACKFVDGNCLGLHGLECSMCVYLDQLETHYLPRHHQTDNQQIQLKMNRYFYQRLFSQGCGICALYDLSSCIDTIKVVGRLMDSELIKKEVSLLKKNILLIDQCDSKEDYLRSCYKASEYLGQDYCINQESCYYKDHG